LLLLSLLQALRCCSQHTNRTDLIDADDAATQTAFDAAAQLRVSSKKKGKK
jgi:hypothetical protein